MNRTDEIKARLEAATPGTWLVSPGDCIDEPSAVYVLVDEMNTDIIANNLLGVDAEFIANAPSDIAYLLEENERLGKALDVRPVVEWFVERMELTLQKNDHKGGWQNRTLEWLHGRLLEEAKELEIAIKNLEMWLTVGGLSEEEWKGVFNRVINESTDVANFAMMIADDSRIHLLGKGEGE